ncbi:MAG: hypothetical protein AAFZ52_15865 [Bacteroidota bacterium]
MSIVSPNIELAVLINSFNRLSLFKDALAALNGWLPADPKWYDKVAVVVYDAGSTDGTQEWLAAQKEKTAFPIEVVTPRSAEEDTSFAAGLNTIAATAIERFPKLKHLLFYETDNQILSAEPLTRAADVLENSTDLAACGFTVKKVDGQPAGIGAPFPSAWKFLLGPKVVHYLQLDAIPCHDPAVYEKQPYCLLDVIYTSPLLVKVSAWQASGGLDAHTFPFSDCDLDWAKVLYDQGQRMAVIPAEGVIHDNQATLSAWSGKRALQYHRGRYRYIRKHTNKVVAGLLPAGLLLRHAAEWAAANVLFLGQRERRRKMAGTASKLFASCLRGYEMPVK